MFLMSHELISELIYVVLNNWITLVDKINVLHANAVLLFFTFSCILIWSDREYLLIISISCVIVGRPCLAIG